MSCECQRNELEPEPCPDCGCLAGSCPDCCCPKRVDHLEGYANAWHGPPKGYVIEATDGSGYAKNQLVFPNEEEAAAYGRDLMSRWLACIDVRVVEVDEVVSYRFENGKLEHVSKLEDA